MIIGSVPDAHTGVGLPAIPDVPNEASYVIELTEHESLDARTTELTDLRSGAPALRKLSFWGAHSDQKNVEINKY